MIVYLAVACSNHRCTDKTLPVQEELLLQRMEEHPLLMLAQEPWEVDKQEAGGANKALVVCAGDQLAGADAVDGSFSSNHSAYGDEKMVLRKRICVREGARQWPRSATSSGATAGSPGDLPEPLTPGADLIVTDFDTMIDSLALPSMEEYLQVDGLPTSTSASSTTASPKLQLVPSPASPIQVQPLPSTTMVVGDFNMQLRHMVSLSSLAPCFLLKKNTQSCQLTSLARATDKMNNGTHDR